MNYFDNTCILCLVRNKNIQSLLVEDTDGTIVEEKLEYVLPELVIFKAELPKNICTDCLKNLNYVYKFKEKCLHNLVSLRNKIKYMSAENKEYILNNSVKNNIEMEDTLLCETQIQKSNEDHNEDQDNVNKTQDASNSSEMEYQPVEEENQTADFEEVRIKEEPKDFHHEIDIKEDPFSQGSGQNEDATQNDQPHHPGYITTYAANTLSEQSSRVPRAIRARAAEGLLPTKSKEAYDKEYDKFQSWTADNCIEIIDEPVLLGYFEYLAESFSPNSLWTKFSMLKKTLMVNKNIDIGMFHKLWKFLKQGSKGYEAKKSKVLTKEEVLKFVHEAPNETYLMVKVALLFGVFGGCRRQELVNMLVDHVEDRGSVIVVSVLGSRSDKNRVFTIIEEKEISSLHLIREYASLRPVCCSERRFFLNYRNGRCTAQPVGKNTFGKIPSTIATFLQLEDADKYNGHCLRRTSATLLADAGSSK